MEKVYLTEGQISLLECVDEMIENNLVIGLKDIKYRMVPLGRTPESYLYDGELTIYQKIEKYLKGVVVIVIMFLSVPSFSQYGEEADKAMGISPRDQDAPGCEYTPIESIFDSITFFQSYEAEVLFGDFTKEQPNISFLFNNTSIMTNGGLNSDDPKRLIKVLGKIDEDHMNIGGEHIMYERYQCEDRSGAKMATVIGFNETTSDTYITLIYHNDVYHYVVKQEPIPEKTHDILDDIESLGYLYDGSDSISYSNEEVKTFLSQFGDPNTILSFMIMDIFVKKCHHKVF